MRVFEVTLELTQLRVVTGLAETEEAVREAFTQNMDNVTIVSITDLGEYTGPDPSTLTADIETEENIYPTKRNIH